MGHPVEIILHGVSFFVLTYHSMDGRLKMQENHTMNGKWGGIDETKRDLKCSKRAGRDDTERVC